MRPASTDLGDLLLQLLQRADAESRCRPPCARWAGDAPVAQSGDRFQSCRFSSQLPKRPVPVLAGFQVMVLFSFDRPVLLRGHPHEPTVQRVVEHGLSVRQQCG